MKRRWDAESVAVRLNRPVAEIKYAFDFIDEVFKDDKADFDIPEIFDVFVNPIKSNHDNFNKKERDVILFLNGQGWSVNLIADCLCRRLCEIELIIEMASG